MVSPRSIGAARSRDYWHMSKLWTTSKNETRGHASRFVVHLLEILWSPEKSKLPISFFVCICYNGYVVQDKVSSIPAPVSLRHPVSRNWLPGNHLEISLL